MEEAAESGDMARLRRADADRYLATLYASSPKRDDLATLYMFNAEIGSVRERIHEPLPGEIRIQWWRDALLAGSRGVAGNPLATALLEIIQRNELPISAFEHYLEARIFDLYNDPMPSRADLEGYCGETASAIMQLAALILAPEAAPSFPAASGHGGCSVAIAGILRLLPHHRARGQCYVPVDILESVGTNVEEFLENDETEAAIRAVEAMVALGREHVVRFEAEAKGMPLALRAAYLPVALVPSYLNSVARAPREALRRSIDISPIRRHWVMLRKAATGWN